MDTSSIENLSEMFQRRVREGGVAFHVRQPSGAFEAKTWEHVGTEVRRLTAGWIAAGLQMGDRVAILMPSSLDWLLLDWSILCAGGVPVPLFSNIRADEIAGYLIEADVRWIVVDTAAHADEVRGLVEARVRPGLRLLCLEDAAAPDVLSVKALRAGGEVDAAAHRAEEAARHARIQSSDLATIACTSGTTGRPKGVMITHRSWIAFLRDMEPLGIVDAELQRTGILLFLPFPHSFARVILLTACMFGLPVVLSDPKTLREDATSMQPGLIPSVPLVFQRMYDGVMTAIRGAPAARRRLAHAALAIGARYAEHVAKGRRPPPWTRAAHAAAELLVLRKIRAGLGLARIHALLSGSVAVPPQVADFFSALGVPLLEGYGATETCGVLTCNGLGRARSGSVGTALRGITLQLAGDGEILAKGESIARRYTDGRSICDEEGWFHTGDVGRLDAGGYLYLTGRKRDLIKTLHGHRVVPYPIEQRLEEHAAIDFAVVVGEGRPHVAALLCLAQGVEETDALRQELASWVERVNGGLAAHEQVRRHRILPERMSVQNGLVTASLKVRRGELRARFESLIEEIYAAG